MGVLDQVNRIKTAVANAYIAAEEKRATMPVTQNVASLFETISSIPQSADLNCNFDLYNSCKVVNATNGTVSGFLKSYSYPGYAKLPAELVTRILDYSGTASTVLSLKFQPQFFQATFHNVLLSRLSLPLALYMMVIRLFLMEHIL